MTYRDLSNALLFATGWLLLVAASAWRWGHEALAAHGVFLIVIAAIRIARTPDSEEALEQGLGDVRHYPAGDFAQRTEAGP